MATELQELVQRAPDTADESPVASTEPSGRPLPWIVTRPGTPYFLTEHGESWTPIGHNDAVSWPELAGLAGRRDLAAVERHLHWLKAHGVNCIRLMLEYCQDERHYLERPAGTFAPRMVQLWDDLFVLLERVGIHALLTPYDTFFTWNRWGRHPYYRRNGGPSANRRTWLTCRRMRAAIKRRLEFATTRWGASPALFAWDLFNEIAPAHGGGDPATLAPFIDDIAPWLRDLELRLHGRAHLQTVSMYNPERLKHPTLDEPILRHPALDFANLHLYEKDTIDNPRDTVEPALATGRLMRDAVIEARDLRPVFDSEHGPIHRFKDRRVTLPEAFDDEYFRHMQWAHLASGGAGGGMRWPNRHPHVLTPGMRRAQRALVAFLPLIDWRSFRRRNCSAELRLSDGRVAPFGCADRDQAMVWLLRTDTIAAGGTLDPAVAPIRLTVEVPGLVQGRYRVSTFDTLSGTVGSSREIVALTHGLTIEGIEVTTDQALAITRVPHQLSIF